MAVLLSRSVAALADELREVVRMEAQVSDRVAMLSLTDVWEHRMGKARRTASTVQQAAARGGASFVYGESTNMELEIETARVIMRQYHDALEDLMLGHQSGGGGEGRGMFSSSSEAMGRGGGGGGGRRRPQSASATGRRTQRSRSPPGTSTGAHNAPRFAQAARGGHGMSSDVSLKRRPVSAGVARGRGSRGVGAGIGVGGVRGGGARGSSGGSGGAGVRTAAGGVRRPRPGGAVLAESAVGHPRNIIAQYNSRSRDQEARTQAMHDRLKERIAAGRGSGRTHMHDGDSGIGGGDDGGSGGGGFGGGFGGGGMLSPVRSVQRERKSDGGGGMVGDMGGSYASNNTSRQRPMSPDAQRTITRAQLSWAKREEAALLAHKAALAQQMEEVRQQEAELESARAAIHQTREVVEQREDEARALEQKECEKHQSKYRAYSAMRKARAAERSKAKTRDETETAEKDRASLIVKVKNEVDNRYQMYIAEDTARRSELDAEAGKVYSAREDALCAREKQVEDDFALLQRQFELISEQRMEIKAAAASSAREAKLAQWALEKREAEYEERVADEEEARLIKQKHEKTAMDKVRGQLAYDLKQLSGWQKKRAVVEEQKKRAFDITLRNETKVHEVKMEKEQAKADARRKELNVIAVAAAEAQDTATSKIVARREILRAKEGQFKADEAAFLGERTAYDLEIQEVRALATRMALKETELLAQSASIEALAARVHTQEANFEDMLQAALVKKMEEAAATKVEMEANAARHAQTAKVEKFMRNKDKAAEAEAMAAAASSAAEAAASDIESAKSARAAVSIQSRFRGNIARRAKSRGGRKGGKSSRVKAGTAPVLTPRTLERQRIEREAALDAELDAIEQDGQRKGQDDWRKTAEIEGEVKKDILARATDSGARRDELERAKTAAAAEKAEEVEKEREEEKEKDEAIAKKLSAERRANEIKAHNESVAMALQARDEAERMAAEARERRENEERTAAVAREARKGELEKEQTTADELTRRASMQAVEEAERFAAEARGRLADEERAAAAARTSREQEEQRQREATAQRHKDEHERETQMTIEARARREKEEADAAAAKTQREEEEIKAGAARLRHKMEEEERQRLRVLEEEQLAKQAQWMRAMARKKERESEIDTLKTPTHQQLLDEQGTSGGSTPGSPSLYERRKSRWLAKAEGKAGSPKPSTEAPEEKAKKRIAAVAIPDASSKPSQPHPTGHTPTARSTRRANGLSSERAIHITSSANAWEQVLDDASGVYYYHNRETGNASWDEPQGWQPTNGSARPEPVDVTSSADTGGEGKAGGGEEVNTGGSWEEVRDPHSGSENSIYYYNSLTGESVWKLPAHAPVSPSKNRSDHHQYVPSTPSNYLISTKHGVKRGGHFESEGEASGVGGGDSGDGKVGGGGGSLLPTPKGARLPSTPHGNTPHAYLWKVMREHSKKTPTHNIKEERAGSGGMEVPEGWSEMVCNESGETFYWNDTTGASQWEHPSEPQPSYNIDVDMS